MARTGIPAPRGRLGALAARRGARGILHVILVVVSLLWLLPSVGLLVSSLRPANLISSTGWWQAFATPFRFTVENYAHVIGQANMGRSFLNSLLIAVPATVMPILVAAFAAYAFAWMRFPGRGVFFLIVVGLLVVPLQVTLIPVLRLFNSLKLTGSFPAIWVAHTAYGLHFAIYLLRNFIGELPGEMMESRNSPTASTQAKDKLRGAKLPDKCIVPETSTP